MVDNLDTNTLVFNDFNKDYSIINKYYIDFNNFGNYLS